MCTFYAHVSLLFPHSDVFSWQLDSASYKPCYYSTTFWAIFCFSMWIKQTQQTKNLLGEEDKALIPTRPDLRRRVRQLCVKLCIASIPIHLTLPPGQTDLLGFFPILIHVCRSDGCNRKSSPLHAVLGVWRQGKYGLKDGPAGLKASHESLSKYGKEDYTGGLGSPISQLMFSFSSALVWTTWCSAVRCPSGLDFSLLSLRNYCIFRMVCCNSVPRSRF